MISAQVIKAIHELLEERGIEQRPNEKLGDYVARGLDISPREAEIFLDGLHDGQSVDEAARSAGISPGTANQGLLGEIARAVGTALGRLASAD